MLIPNKYDLGLPKTVLNGQMLEGDSWGLLEIYSPENPAIESVSVSDDM